MKHLYMLQVLELQAQQAEQASIPITTLIIRVIEASIVLLATYIIARYIVGYIPRIIPVLGQVRAAYNLVTALRYLVYAIGVLVALAIIAPEPGVFSALLLIIGIGIIVAFSDLLRNWGAEVYVRTFTRLKIGDQVEIMGREGTVIHIDSRGIIIETPTREKIYVPNSYLASSVLINRTSLYGTTYRIKILVPIDQETPETIEKIREIVWSLRPELVEDPIVSKKGSQEGYSVYEATVVLLNVRKIDYIVSRLREDIERIWRNSRVYV